MKICTVERPALAAVLTLGISALYAGEAAAVPAASLTFNATSAPKLDEQVEVSFTFDNSSLSGAGFFPLMRVVLPPEVDFAGGLTCGELGSPADHKVFTYDTDGDSPLDPYTNQVVSLLEDEELVVILPPTGQISPTQTPITCSFNAALVTNVSLSVSPAEAGKAFTIAQAFALFVAGDNASASPNGIGGCDKDAGGPPYGLNNAVCSAPQSALVTPTLMEFTKDIHSPTGGTGPNYPATTTIIGDLATLPGSRCRRNF